MDDFSHVSCPSWLGVLLLSPSGCVEASLLAPGYYREGLLWCSGDLGKAGSSAHCLFTKRGRGSLVPATFLSPHPSLPSLSSDIPAFDFVDQGMVQCLLLYPNTPHSTPHPCKKPGRKGCLLGRLTQHDGGCYGEQGSSSKTQHRPSPAWSPPPTESCLWVVLLAGETKVEGQRWTCGGGLPKGGYGEISLKYSLTV